MGNIGLMICWDIGHRRLWRSYAGRVELIICLLDKLSQHKIPTFIIAVAH
ncbi:MAG: hypothetical protein EHM41_14440 [Chloroflexi bacterium]|nr:MAG: hypothetical protein EHM41_14440 [Chloroflexota bacterium]